MKWSDVGQLVSEGAPLLGALLTAPISAPVGSQLPAPVVTATTPPMDTLLPQMSLLLPLLMLKLVLLVAVG